MSDLIPNELPVWLKSKLQDQARAAVRGIDGMLSDSERLVLGFWQREQRARQLVGEAKSVLVDGAVPDALERGARLSEVLTRLEKLFQDWER